MDIKVSTDKYISRWVDEENLIDEIELKTVNNKKEGDQQRKKSKTLSEVKIVENISKNPQSSLEVSPEQKVVLLSQKRQNHAYE